MQNPTHHQQSSSLLYTRLNASSQANSSLTIDQDNSTANSNQRKLPKSSIYRNDMIPLQCLDVGTLLKIHERNDYSRLQFDSLTDGTPSYNGSSLDLEWEHEYDRQKYQPSEAWLNRSQDGLSMTCSDENCSVSELSAMMSSTSKLNNETANTKTMKIKVQSRASSQNDLENYNFTMKRTKNRGKMKSNTSWSHISTPDSLEWDVHEDDQKLKSEDDLLDQETVELLDEIEWLKNRALNETGDFSQTFTPQEES